VPSDVDSLKAVLVELLHQMRWFTRFLTLQNDKYQNAHSDNQNPTNPNQFSRHASFLPWLAALSQPR
jgi:hypothetical protein